MQVYDETIGGNIRFLGIMEDRFKTDELVIRFAVPNDPKTQSGYILLPCVMGRGCEAYPTKEKLNEHLDDLYDLILNVNSTEHGDSRVIRFSTVSLEKDCVPGKQDLFCEALSVLGELLFHPLTENGGFFSSYTETEKKNLTDAIRQANTNKYNRALSLCRRAMWNGHPRGIPPIGTEEGVRAVTPENLFVLYGDMLRRAPILCTYIGKRDPKETARLLKTFFEPILGEREKAEPFVLSDPFGPDELAELSQTEEELPYRQSVLVLGCRTDVFKTSPDFRAFLIFDEIFSGSPVSKLFTRVREERGLCYDCSAQYDNMSGIYYITSGIDAENRDAAEQEIGLQLDAMQAGDFTAEELETAKKSVISSIRMITDNRSDICAWISNRTLDGMNTDIDTEISAILAVTKDDVMRAAGKVKKQAIVFLRGTVTEDGEDADEDDAYGM